MPKQEADVSFAVKYRRLKERLRLMKRVLIAFSGGVDSSLLLYVARQVLSRDDVLATTGSPCKSSSRWIREKRLSAGFGPMPEMIIEQIGYGAGTSENEIPNLLRLMIGNTSGAENGQLKESTPPAP